MGCGKSSDSNASSPKERPKVIFVMGGPGSGKGTQCSKLVEEYGLKHLSTGDLLREERKKGGELGDELDKIMNEGGLVSSDLVVKLVRKNMKEMGWSQEWFLIDGFPRNEENMKAWKKGMKDVEIQFALFFDVPDEIMVERMMKWAETSGRADDNEETMKKRVKTFRDQTVPLVQSFEKKKLARTINAAQGIDEVWEETKSAM